MRLTRRAMIAGSVGTLLPLSGLARQTRGQTDSLRVGLVSRTFFYAPLWVGIEAGAFRTAGLDVSPVVLDSAAACTELLKSGELDLAIATPEGVMSDADAGGSLRIIAGNTSRLSHYLVSQARFRRIADLRDAIIGVASLKEGTTYHIREILARHELAPGDYHLREVGGAPTRARLLKEGAIDAGLQSIPWNYIAEDQGLAVLADANDYIREYQFTSINADLRRAQHKRPQVVSFLRAMQSSTRQLYAEPERASTVVAREMDISPLHARRACDDFAAKNIMPHNLSVSHEGLAAAYAHLHGKGTPAGRAADITHVLDLSFWRESRKA